MRRLAESGAVRVAFPDGSESGLHAAFVFFAEFATVLTLRQAAWILDVDIAGAPEFGLAVLLSLVLTRFAFGLDPRRLLMAALVANAVLAAAVAVSLAFEDASMDGQTYHFYIVDRLMRGWSPFHEPSDYWPVVVNHYAKGVETFQSDLALLAGSFSAAFAVNLAALAMAVTVAGRFFGVAGRSGWLGAVLVVAGPVVVTQLFTKYVDGTLASVYAALIFAHLLRYHRGLAPRPWAVMVFVLSYILISTKFTGVFYAATANLVFLALLVIRERRIGRLWRAAPLAVLLVAMTPHPYLTNLRAEGDPFYPVLNADQEIALSRYPFPDFEHLNPVQRFFVANMSPPKKYFAPDEAPDVSATGYGVLKQLKYRFGWLFFQAEYSIKINGFGIFWPALLWFGLFCLFRYAPAALAAEGGAGVAVAAAAMLSMGVLMPEGWLSRFAPMVYSGAALAIVWWTARWSRWPRFVALASLAANLGLSLSMATAQNVLKSARIRAEEQSIHAGAHLVATGLLQEWRARLERRGASVEIVTDPAAFDQICGAAAFMLPSNGGAKICFSP